MPLCTCPEIQLCERCFGRALLEKCGQAASIGQCWAERVARHPEYRERESWPDDERALGISARLVERLAVDPRLRAELARACVDGAAAWWGRRPERYR